MSPSPFDRFILKHRPYCEMAFCINPSAYVIDSGNAARMRVVCEHCLGTVVYPPPNFPAPVLADSQTVSPTCLSHLKIVRRDSRRSSGEARESMHTDNLIADKGQDSRGGENLDENYHNEPVNQGLQLPAEEEPVEEELCN